MNIFQAFLEGMHDDNLEGFVEWRHDRYVAQSSVQRAYDYITVLRYEEKEERKNHATNQYEQ